MEFETLEFCFVTWVTHNSRVSERMVEFLPPDFIKGLDPVILNCDDQIFVAQLIAECISKYELPTVTFNVLPDHVHALFAVKSEKELELKVGNSKGYSSHVFRKEKILEPRLWARKFNRNWIKSDEHLGNVIAYINENHIKHQESWGKDFLCGFRPELSKIVEAVCQSPWEILGVSGEDE